MTPHIKALSALTLRGQILFISIVIFCLCTNSQAQDNGTDSDRTVAINSALNSIEQISNQATAAPSWDKEPQPQTVAVSPIEVNTPPAEPATPSVTPSPSLTQAAPPPVSSQADAAPLSQELSYLFPAGAVKISGEIHAGMGIDSSGNAIFSRANADLNEKNYRLLSSDALNNNINTYDPAIYSRLKVVMDATVAASVVSVHLNISVDPWSFTGKSNTQTVTSSFGDTAKIQYLTWGNTGYTVNSIINTMRLGDLIETPEIKTNGNIVPATTIGSNNTAFGDTFNVPAAKINYSFFPFREAWVDIKPTDEIKLRVFPVGYGDQALTTDDPLRLSNSTEWWAESPWLDGWQQGTLNVGQSPVNFTKGQWDKSLSFFTKDSDGVRLTALRGVSLKLDPTDETSLDATIATPKTLWQDYGDITALPASARLKQYIGDQFYVGAVGNMHEGYDSDGQIDAENYTGGTDAGLMLTKGLKVNAEYAASKSIYDETSPQYTTKYDGNAYYVSLETASNPEDEDLLRKDYLSMKPAEKMDSFYKSRVSFARMDQGFESSLSDYHGTRGDSFWDDHLTFYPSDYRYLPGGAPHLSDDDLTPFGIGDGMDYGRSVISWRGDVNLMDGKIQGLADFRHVTNNYGDNLENVARTQWTFQATDKLTTKALFLWDALPKTTAGIDPFVVYDPTGQYFNNSAVVGGQDPSLKTGSLGARYTLTDWAAINGVWEHTNDFVLGTNEYPETVFDTLSVQTVTQNGRTYLAPFPFVYDQSYFEQAPYPYYNIFKTGLELTPSEKWHIYLNYTRNPNKFAGNFDDNMNHYGIEANYNPTSKIGFFASTVFSQGYDISRLVNDSELDYRNYVNFFFEARMVLPKDVLMSIQYGVGPSYNIQTSATNPNLTYSSTVLETQHIIRIVFDKKF